MGVAHVSVLGGGNKFYRYLGLKYNKKFFSEQCKLKLSKISEYWLG